VNSSSSWAKEARKFYGKIGDVVTYTDTGYPNDGIIYYWRVRAGNDGGWSSWSESQSFTNTGNVIAPILSSPEDEATVSGTSVTFTWEVASGATKYMIDVHTASRMEVNAVLDLAVNPDWSKETQRYKGDVGNACSKTLTNFGDDGTTYYWRVKASSADGWGPWSESQSFVNASSTAPADAPTLSIPSDGARISGSSITFTWTASEGASKYQLEVNSSPRWDKGTKKYRRTLGDVLTTTVTSFTNEGTRYYWRVRARNAAGWSEWSEPQTFVNGSP